MTPRDLKRKQRFSMHSNTGGSSTETRHKDLLLSSPSWSSHLPEHTTGITRRGVSGARIQGALLIFKVAWYLAGPMGCRNTTHYCSANLIHGSGVVQPARSLRQLAQRRSKVEMKGWGTKSEEVIEMLCCDKSLTSVVSNSLWPYGL